MIEAAHKLADRGMKAPAAFAAEKPHGDRLRYMAGCRCFHCRRANSDYEAQRKVARAAGDWNGLVSAERARAHIHELSAKGVGYKSLSVASSVATSVVSAIKSGTKLRITARTERRLLAVTEDALAPSQLVDARPTWKLLRSLLAQGYTRKELASALGGTERRSLQIRKDRVTVKTAHDVEVLHARLRRVNSAATERLLAELREEGYRADVITQRLEALADRRLAPRPDLRIERGLVLASTADLVRALHCELTE